MKLREDIEELPHDPAPMLFGPSASKPGGCDIAPDVFADEERKSDLCAFLRIRDKPGHRDARILERLQRVHLGQYRIGRKQTIGWPDPEDQFASPVGPITRGKAVGN